MDIVTSTFDRSESMLIKQSLLSIRMADGDDGVRGYFKGLGYGHSPLELPVSFWGFYPGNGFFEAAGVPGKGQARFTGVYVYFSSVVLQSKSCLVL